MDKTIDKSMKNTQEKNEDKIIVGTEIEVTLKMIGGKCKPLILYILIESGVKRFKELMCEVSQISQKTLTNQLRELEADGLITRECFAQVPPRVEYSITKKGETLFPILELMCTWGKENMDDRFYLSNPQCEQ